MMNEYYEKLNTVISVMRNTGVDFLYIPLSDDHQSEYVSDAYQSIRFLTGFSGSNATVVFCAKEDFGIYLWTDGRYFIQAQSQLSGSGVTLMRMGEKDVPTIDQFLKSRIEKGDKVVLCGPLCDAISGIKIEEITAYGGGIFESISDMKMFYDIGIKPESKGMFEYMPKYAGLSMAQKVDNVRSKLRDMHCTALALKSLEEICWLFNIRGMDIPCNPVVLSFAVITMEKAYLYLYDDTPMPCNWLSDHDFEIRNYDAFYEDLRSFDEIFLYDKSSMNYQMSSIIKSGKYAEGENPIPLMKAVKNDAEIKWTRQRYLEDSIALTECLVALRTNAKIHEMTEYDCAMKVDEYRMTLRDYLDKSFDTIAAFGPNAAMMHYEPTKEKSDRIGEDNLLLIDSGGQYLGATTDVTRTIPFGNISREMKEAYTETVIANLRLMDAVFIKGTCGLNLDILARERFWKKGMDYKCGTGHGIGSCLSVHEAPPNISYQYRKGREVALMPGMIVSDEPGVYREGEFGIRVENILLVTEAFETPEGVFYKFENLTKVPLENSLMLKELMSEEDIARYNAFQKDVRESISPYLSDIARDFVQNMTSEL